MSKYRIYEQADKVVLIPKDVNTDNPLSVLVLPKDIYNKAKIFYESQTQVQKSELPALEGFDYFIEKLAKNFYKEMEKNNEKSLLL